MWQNCPNCMGTGMKNIAQKCDVCNGKKIINELTGLPPNGINVIKGNTYANNEDFRDRNMESQQEYFGK